MRKLYFLVPGTTKKFGGGGLWAELKILQLAQQICSAEIVTYRQREESSLFLADLLKNENLNDCIFVVSWGFDVPKLIKKLKLLPIIYHAHSAGYGFDLPTNIPILAVSRNTMGYWGQKSPNSLIYYLPNQIDPAFTNLNQPRDIDVLVQTRKSSQYLLAQLVPALQKKFQVKVVDGYVEDLVGLFNRTKIYLYDSAEYWAVNGVTEGFGLPPLEALACGCQVFSSVNSALADYLDPSFNCYKIAGYALEFDLNRIISVLNSSDNFQLPELFFEQYQAENILKRLEIILTEVNLFFDHYQSYQTKIAGLDFWRAKQLWSQKILQKVGKKIGL
ncbi:glycosyl transferase, group 1 [Stanieria sp. NIES-3757]|nr:glycosyl transferase, group 1 [Stanieria sp. NIES-3757]